MAVKVNGRYHYSGVVHIHTTESDGTLPIQDVIDIGRKAGVDFMMFSDHMGLGNREAGHEGIYGKTLVVIGYEHNDLDDNNHLLIFNSPGVYDAASPAAEYVRATRRDGGFGIVAHPVETRSRMGKYPPYPWLEWSADEFDGFEIWNQMSEWMEKLTRWNKVLMAFSPRKSMVGPSDETMRIWDEYNRNRRYVGVAGGDAHAFPVKVWPWTVTIFPYKVHFRALRTHIILDEPLSDDFETARRQFYAALGNCRVFCSNMRWGEANKFVFEAADGSRTYVCGDDVPVHEGVKLRVLLPATASIRLICNGQTITMTRSDRLELAVSSPGLYRVEAWKGKRGWIFSNHIRIGRTGDRS